MHPAIDNLVEFLTAFAHNKSVQIVDSADFTFVTTNENFAYPKFIVYKNCDESILKASIESIEAPVLKNIPIQIPEHVATPQNLFFLKQKGFVPITFWTNMTFNIAENNLNAAKNVNTSVVILNELKNDFFDHLNNWIKIVENELFKNLQLNADYFIQLMQQQKVKLFLLYYNNMPVSSTLLFTGRDAGLYMVATDNAYKGKGFAKLLLSEVFQNAEQLGYKQIVLQSTKEGFAFYTKLGFEKATKAYILKNIL